MMLGVICLALGIGVAIWPNASAALLHMVLVWSAEGQWATVAAVAIVGFFEGLLLVGLVFPGSTLLVLLAFAAVGSGLNTVLVGLAAVVGIMSAYVVNALFLARRSELLRHPKVANALLLVHQLGWRISIMLLPVIPSFGGVLAFLVGGRRNVAAYLLMLLLSVCFWVAAATTLVALFGDIISSAVREGGTYFSVVLIAFGILEIGLHLRRGG